MNTICKLMNVKKIFGEREIFNNLNVEFGINSSYVLQGENGSGKTTLLNMISQYIFPDAGKIFVNGRIGYLFQDEMLFSNLTVEQNINLKLSALKHEYFQNEDIIDEVLSYVNLSGFEKNKTASLSGGERQRLELIIVSLMKPDLLLLDEPTSHLDNGIKKNIVELIDELFKTTTKIIVTHDILLYPDTYEHLVIKDGGIVNV